MKKIKNTFGAGLFLFLPIALAVYFIIWSFDELDAILEPMFTNMLGYYWTGLGFLALIIIIFVIGAIVRSFIGKQFVKSVEKLFSTLPLVKTLYTPIKEVLTNVAGGSNNGFKDAVLVDFPNKGIQSIGFITNKELEVNGNIKVSVFIPTTPNPTNGFLVIVDEQDLIYLNMPIDEAVKAVVAMGTTVKIIN